MTHRPWCRTGVPPRRLASFALAWIVPVLLAADARAQTVRIEEDWELRVSVPDARSSSPQVTCSISPTGRMDSIHARFELNQRSLPSFVPGGMQLQLWNGNAILAVQDAHSTATLAAAKETIRWTTAMSLSKGIITIEVVNGQSTTWGDFGNGTRVATPSSLENLDGYQPPASIDHSEVCLGANQVRQLSLKRIRWIKASGQAIEDSLERVVHIQRE